MRELKTPVQIGENFSLPDGMAAALAAGAADYVMPDLERIGGVTGWQRAAALAAAHRIEMSSHLFPEVSAHLLAATPTCHFLEYVDWADKLVESRCGSSTAAPLRPSGRATGSRGTRRRSRNIALRERDFDPSSCEPRSREPTAGEASASLEDARP